jgi:hypothetical protein
MIDPAARAALTAMLSMGWSACVMATLGGDRSAEGKNGRRQ